MESLLFIWTILLANLSASYSRRRRSTESQNIPEFVSYIIGEDKDCKSTSEIYCNGYLKPFTEYKVKTLMCTENGCTESEWSEAMKTDYDPTVAITVPVVLIIFTAATLIVVLMLRRKGMGEHT